MRSLRVLPLLAVVAVAALPSATADAAAAKRKPCSTAKGTTLAASAAARVYRTGDADDGRVWGCWLRTERRTSFGQVYEVGESSSEIELVSVAGRYVGFESAGGSGEDPEDGVVLADLATGRTTHADAVVSDDDPAAVTAVLPTAAGSLVWAGRAADCVGLHVAGIGAAPRTLSCGAVSDVAVAGARVYWTQDGQPRTALLG